MRVNLQKIILCSEFDETSILIDKCHIPQSSSNMRMCVGKSRLKIFLAKNFMKCSDLHRNIMFANHLHHGGWGLQVSFKFSLQGNEKECAALNKKVIFHNPGSHGSEVRLERVQGLIYNKKILLRI